MKMSLRFATRVTSAGAVLLMLASACGGDKASGVAANSDVASGGSASTSSVSDSIADSGGAPSSSSSPDGEGGASVAQGGTTAEQGGTASTAGGVTTSPVPIEATATVALAPGTTYQTLEGFGAAVAWYQSSLTGHGKKAELYQLLFADLGLDIIRFRNTFGRSEFANAPRDKLILDAATVSLGRRPKVLMSSWSPPASLKANGIEKCSGEATCTLKQSDGAYVYDEFATYWLDALAAYAAIGITMDWISIQNEPDFIPNGWEGCKFIATESTVYPGYDKALAAVAAKLTTILGAPRLVGPEILGIHYNKPQNYLPALDQRLLSAVAHHLYERGSDGIWDWRSPGPDSFLTVMQGTKLAAGSLPIFQTEFSTDEDNKIDGGFETAWLIHNSLVEEGVSAWLYWDLIWGAGAGLVSLPDATNYSVRDQYYSLRHFSRYTDPGYVRIGANASNSNIRASAFRSPDQKRITAVLLNVGPTEERVRLDLGGFVVTNSETYRTIYIPGSSTRWESIQATDQGGPVALPSRSVATIVFES